jgi:phage I-like protein
MISLIQNRALVGPSVELSGAQFKTPDDGFYHVVPKGDFPHAEAGIVQVLDDDALKAIFNDLKSRGADVLIDDEHFSYDVEKSSDAMGWAAEDYQLRPNGIWAKPRWTNLGADALKNGVKRFISPVFLPRDAKPIGGNRFRVLRIDSWGLTNTPNMRGMVPLSNRHSAFAGSAEANNNTTKGHHMKSVAESLGLSADASETAVLAEVTKLKNRAQTAEDALTPLKNRVKELETSNGELLNAQVDADISPLKGKMPDDQLASLRTAMLANRATLLPIVSTMVETLKSDKSGKALFNRGSAKVPDGQKTDDSRIQNQAAAVREYQIKNRCTYDDAWKAVRAQKPELFEPETK